MFWKVVRQVGYLCAAFLLIISELIESYPQYFVIMIAILVFPVYVKLALITGLTIWLIFKQRKRKI